MFEWLLLLIQIILVSKEININSYSCFLLPVLRWFGSLDPMPSLISKEQTRQQTKTLKNQWLIKTMTVDWVSNTDWVRNGLLLTWEITQVSICEPVQVVVSMFLGSPNEMLGWVICSRNKFHVKWACIISVNENCSSLRYNKQISSCNWLCLCC